MLRSKIHCDGLTSIFCFCWALMVSVVDRESLAISSILDIEVSVSPSSADNFTALSTT